MSGSSTGRLTVPSIGSARTFTVSTEVEERMNAILGNERGARNTTHKQSKMLVALSMAYTKERCDTLVASTNSALRNVAQKIEAIELELNHPRRTDNDDRAEPVGQPVAGLQDVPEEQVEILDPEVVDGIDEAHDANHVEPPVVADNGGHGVDPEQVPEALGQPPEVIANQEAEEAPENGNGGDSDPSEDDASDQSDVEADPEEEPEPMAYVLDLVDSRGGRGYPNFTMESEDTFAEWADGLKDYLVMTDDRMTEARKVASLKCRLSRFARKRFDALTPAEMATFDAAVAALTPRFDTEEDSVVASARLKQLPTMRPTESVLEYSEKLERMVRRALSNEQPEVVESALRLEFLNRLPRNLAVYVREKRPTTFQEAVQLARGREALLCIPFDDEQSPAVAVAQMETQKLRAELQEAQRKLAEATQQRSKPSGERVPVDQARCFGCNELGHYKRNCPAKGKKPASAPAAQSDTERELRQLLQEAREQNQRLAAALDQGVNFVMAAQTLESPRRASKPKQLIPVKAKVMLNVVLGLLLITVASAQKPMVCQMQAPATVIEFPSEKECGLQAMKLHVMKPLGLKVFQPDVAVHNVSAVHCRIVEETVRYRTSFEGWPLQSTTTRDLPVTPEECERMHVKKECTLGALVTHGLVARTDFRLNLEWPWRFFGSFSDRVAKVTNCFAYETEVWTRNSGASLEATVADVSSCKYSNGQCHLPDGSMLVWEPQAQDACQFRELSYWEGHAGNNSWTAETGEFALTFTEPKTLTECNRNLVISDQGYAVPEVAYAQIQVKERHARHVRVGAVLSPQLAAQLTAMGESFDEVLEKRLSTMIKSQRSATSATWGLFLAMLDLEPTVVLRGLLRDPHLQAQSLGSGLVRVWPCTGLADGQWKLRQVTERCTLEVPVALKSLAGWQDAFLDPRTLIISKSSTTVRCDGAARQVIVRMNGEVKAINTATGQTEKVNVQPWKPIGGAAGMGVAASARVFHNLPLNGVDELIPSHHFQQAVRDAHIRDEIEAQVRALYQSDASAELVKGGFFGFLALRAVDPWQLWVFLCCLYVTLTVVRVVIVPLLVEYMFGIVLARFTRRSPAEMSTENTRTEVVMPASWPPQLQGVFSATVLMETGSRAEGVSPSNSNLAAVTDIPLGIGGRKKVAVSVARLNGVATRALLDTGASVTLVPLRMAQLLGVANLEKSDMSVTSVSKQRLAVVGTASMEVAIGGSSVITKAHFVDQDSTSPCFDVIIGVRDATWL